jgi:hypothetical protein
MIDNIQEIKLAQLKLNEAKFKNQCHAINKRI